MVMLVASGLVIRGQKDMYSSLPLGQVGLKFCSPLVSLR